jgi:hypothetical protein
MRPGQRRRRMALGAFLLCLHQPSRQPRELGRAISWARLSPEEVSDQATREPELGQAGCRQRPVQRPHILRGDRSQVVPVPRGLRAFNPAQRMGAEAQRPEVCAGGLAAGMGFRSQGRRVSAGAYGDSFG